MKINKESSCQYYYGQEDASLWWDLPYHKALEVKMSLCRKIIDELCLAHYLSRDAERINRLLKVEKDLQKQLKDKPNEIHI